MAQMTFEQFLENIPEERKASKADRNNLYKEFKKQQLANAGPNEVISNPLLNSPQQDTLTSEGPTKPPTDYSGVVKGVGKAAGAAVGTNLASTALGGGLGELGVMTGANAGPLTASQASAMGMVYPAVGAAALGTSMYNYGGRNILKGRGTTGDYVDTTLGSNPVTGWVNPLLDVAGLGTVGSNLFGKGKSGEQRSRDQGRDVLANAGFAKKINGEHFVTLANGENVSIGKDGGSTFDGFGGEKVKTAFGVDSSHPLADQATALVDPISYGLFGDNEDVRSAMSIQMANAALRNSNSEEELIQNIRSMYKSAGMTVGQFNEMFNELEAKGVIDPQTKEVFKGSINTIQSNQGSKNPLAPPAPPPADELPEMPQQNPLTKKLEKQVAKQQDLQNRLSIPAPVTAADFSGKLLDIHNFNQEQLMDTNPLERRI